MAKQKEIPNVYTRDDVFAAAVAAQRINGEYVKRSNNYNYGNGRYGYRAPNPEQKRDPNATKLPNSSVMKTILSSGMVDITADDRAKGEEIRAYFCAMIVLVFSGNAKDFMKSAVDVATCEEIADNTKEFGLAASLPSVYERMVKRSNERETLSNLTANSIPLTQAVYDTVTLNVTVVDCIFKERFGSYAINALVNKVDGVEPQGSSVVFFFIKGSWTKGNTYNIRGRIKNKGNQTTQLHYVRQLTPDGQEKYV